MIITIDKDYAGLVDEGDRYVFNGNITLWEEEDVVTKKDRKLQITLQRPLIIKGTLKVNGYMGSIYPVDAKTTIIGNKYL